MHALKNLHYQLQGAVDTVNDSIDSCGTQLGSAITHARKRRTAMYPLSRIAEAVSAPFRRASLMNPRPTTETHTYMKPASVQTSTDEESFQIKMQEESFLPDMEEEEESFQTNTQEESFIRRVLKFQKSAGVFDVPQTEALGCLGSDVHGIVQTLHDKGVRWELAVTAAIVVWLEVKYAQDRRLWVRMVEKAREYMQPHLGMGLGEGEQGSMLDVAERMARDVKN